MNERVNTLRGEIAAGRYPSEEAEEITARRTLRAVLGPRMDRWGAVPPVKPDLRVVRYQTPGIVGGPGRSPESLAITGLILSCVGLIASVLALVWLICIPSP